MPDLRKTRFLLQELVKDSEVAVAGKPRLIVPVLHQ
jgi:hypothetical protein